MPFVPRTASRGCSGRADDISIHPSAVVDPSAILDPGARIGPYVVIDGPVRIGCDTVVDSFAVISGNTEIGANCHIHAGAVVGGIPQDRAYTGGESYCVIGDGVEIREGASVHRGTAPGSTTRVGNRCFIMANAHVGHNCVLEDEVILINGVLLGGHVHVGAKAVISGNAAVHQFVRIGSLAMIGGLTKVTRDIVPFLMADGDGTCVGINKIGLRRAGYTREASDDVRAAFKVLYRSALPFSEAIATLTATMTTNAGQQILSFLRAPSKRGITGGRPYSRRVDVSESPENARSEEI